MCIWQHLFINAYLYISIYLSIYIYIYIYSDIYGSCIIFYRSLPLLIISHTYHQHSSMWVSNVHLNRAAQAQESPQGLVFVMRRHNNGVRIKLLPPMSRYVTACFHLVRSAYVTTPTSPGDFSREGLIDKKIIRHHLYIMVLYVPTLGQHKYHTLGLHDHYQETSQRKITSRCYIKVVPLLVDYLTKNK